LPRKLGIKEGMRLALIDAPAEFVELLGALPNGVVVQRKATANTDIAHVFVVDDEILARRLVGLRKQLRPDAVLWVSWPKKSSGVPTTVTEDVIRRRALPLGLVDVKVCAVDDTWSGLKLVVRKELR